MLSPVILLARKLRSRRLTLRMTQRQVARAVGCSQAYVAHLESGLRPCSRRVGLLLERLYRVRQGSYSKLGLRRGRPGLKPGARLVLREVKEAREVSSPRELAPLPRGPRFPRAQRVRQLGDPLWPIALHLGLEAAEEVRLLERRRRGQVGFWRLLNSLRFDSWSEKRLNVKVGLECEQLLELAPGKVGCEMRCVDGMTGRDAHHRATAAFVLRQGETSVVWFPQLCVRTDRGYRWPDCTLVVACQGRKRTLVVELNGPDYHPDPAQDEARARELGVPVLSLHPDQLGAPDFVARLLKWAVARLG